MSDVLNKKPYFIERLFNDQPIGAGATVGGLVEVKGFGRIIVMVKGDQTYDLYSTPSPDASTVFTALKETLASAVAANAPELKEPAKLAPHLYVEVKNTSVSAGKYDVWVYGI